MNFLGLPTDIGQRIFQEAFPTGNPPPGTGGPPQPPPPLAQQWPMVLSQINSQLRINAVGTPELWQSLAVDTGYRGQSFNAALVGLWMSRAGLLPRDVSLTTRDIKRGVEMLAASMDYTLQWRDVALKLPMESYAALAAHRGPFPFLRTLQLSMNSGAWEGTSVTTIRDAPLLRRLVLMDFPAVTTDVPWAQLTSLQMCVHEVEPGIAILRHCTGLTELDFALYDTSRTLPVLPPVMLPDLRSLVTSARSIIHYLTTPSLDELMIWGPGFSKDMDELTASLSALCARSPCAPTTLHFRLPQISPTEFTAFLRENASVTTLKLTLHFTSGLDTLVRVLEAADVLPALTTLSVVEMSRGEGDEMPFEPMLDVVRARREVVVDRARLERFNISLHHRQRNGVRVPPASMLGALDALADGGLRVRVANESGVLMDR
ncbi:hypothetical protein C8R46DRAFT_1192581 [Mycena filopes]|nr:hypothetical protein C8R46DRAFT_1192581 [Mycena filopes]